MYRIVIRCFQNGVLKSLDRMEVDTDEIDQLLPQIARKHAYMLAEQPGHIEIEFLDEPDVNQRFFRMGTDPTYMRDPIQADPTKTGEIHKALRRWGRKPE